MGLWWASEGQAHRPSRSTSNHRHDRLQSLEPSMDLYLKESLLPSAPASGEPG